MIEGIYISLLYSLAEFIKRNEEKMIKYQKVPGKKRQSFPVFLRFKKKNFVGFYKNMKCFSIHSLKTKFINTKFINFKFGEF